MWRTPTNPGQAWSSVNGADDQPDRKVCLFGSFVRSFAAKKVWFAARTFGSHDSDYEEAHPNHLAPTRVEGDGWRGTGR